MRDDQNNADVQLAGTVFVKGVVRQRLPKHRQSHTHKFRIADFHGFYTIGEFEDGRPGEIFIKASKQGSTLSGIFDSLSRSVSYGLQYGVPLKAFIESMVDRKFAPSGVTDDPEIRTASSPVDYIFRRLALDYLSPEERAEIGLAHMDEARSGLQNAKTDAS